MLSAEMIILIVSLIIIGLLIFRICQLQNRMKANQLILQTIEYSKDLHYYYSFENGGHYKYISKNVDQVLGEGFYAEQMADPQKIFEILHPDDVENFKKKESSETDFSKAMTYRIRHKNGHYVWLEEHVTPIYKDGKIDSLYGLYRDISEQMKLKEQLHYKLTHDSLTNVYNRTFFDELFNKYDLHVNDRVGIMICDLDRLKQINDLHGHSAGDVYIQNAARFLKRFEKENVYLSRIGGDEFALFAIGDQVDYLKDLKHSILKELVECTVENLEMSIGYAKVENSLGNLKGIFEQADRFMYLDKNNRSESRGMIYTR